MIDKFYFLIFIAIRHLSVYCKKLDETKLSQVKIDEDHKLKINKNF